MIMPMTRTQPDAYLTPYLDALDEHGPDFGVTLWASPQAQRLRFDVMLQMCYFQGKRVLDVGCSRGDFAAHLIERGIAYQQFVGIDALCEVIEYAQQRELPQTTFICGDGLSQPTLLSHGQPQIVCLSGTLNTMTDQTALDLLQHAWQATQEVLLFNFLSDRVAPAAPPQEYPARRLDTTRLLDWAMQQTWAVQFRQDYFRFGHDATILMRKA